VLKETHFVLVENSVELRLSALWALLVTAELGKRYYRTFKIKHRTLHNT